MRLFICSLAVSALAITSCSSEEDSSPASAELRHIPVVTIAPRDIILEKFYVTDIQAVQHVEIRSRISGFLERILVDEGQYVRKGQPLFRLSDRELRTEVARAQAALRGAQAEARTAELEVDRVRLLVEKKVISATELELAQARLKSVRAKVEEAASALEHARTRLAYTDIRAPFDGIIDRMPLKVGSLLEEGTLLTSMSDISSVYAYFSISENEYLTYLRNQHTDDNHADEVKLILSDGQEYAHAGRIETVVSEFDEHTGSIAFRARFPNPGRLLKHGASGKVELSTDLDDALLIPQKSVFEIQDKNYVFVIDTANQAQMRSFEPAGRIDDYYIVESGLQQGERIAYEGIQNIKDGMIIEPGAMPADSLISRAGF